MASRPSAAGSSRLPPEARLAVYRAAQEALANVRKHAPRSAVELRLTWTAQDAVLVVENFAPADGDVPAPRDGGGAGYGLTGMAERA